ncbi:MAG: hypothetical protein U1F27_06070 [Turneriella sp.]
MKKAKLLRPQSYASEVKITLKSSHKLMCQWRGIMIEYTATETGIHFKASGSKALVISVRPFNVEGPALLYKLHYHEKKNHLTGDADLIFAKAPNQVLVSDWKNGDALRRIVPRIRRSRRQKHVIVSQHDAKDSIGLTTAAFYFASADHCEGTVNDHQHETIPAALRHKSAAEITAEYFADCLSAELPKGYGDWLEHAKNHMVSLWDYDTIKPGSYTYHHFWIRDAVIMMYALLLMGAKKAVRPIIERFAGMVRPSGLFQSQTGEWDSNGQALWILAQYVRYTHDQSIITSLKKQIERMLNWIQKEIQQNGGVLPPGFSAEHLGPADWYLWDNFWALGGLKQITPYLEAIGLADRARAIYDKLAGSLNIHLSHYSYLPAALGRGKDAGMIGSIAAAYPLQIEEFCDARLTRTLDILTENYFHRGCFFQENIHSGINPYLTLQVAQSYLHIGQTATARRIIRSIREKAQKAYTFPEGIHVRTGGGCMGDGFHGWASAESVIILRNMLVREVRLKGDGEALIWLSGFRDKWLTEGATAKNLYTPWSVSSLELEKGSLKLSGLSSAVLQVLSLPAGWSAKHVETGAMLKPLPPELLPGPISDERVYLVLDEHDNAARLVLMPGER